MQTIMVGKNVEIIVHNEEQVDIVWLDWEGGIHSEIQLDGSEFAVVRKYVNNTDFVLDMISKNRNVCPFPLECDEVGNVL